MHLYQAYPAFLGVSLVETTANSIPTVPKVRSLSYQELCPWRNVVDAPLRGHKKMPNIQVRV